MDPSLPPLPHASASASELFCPACGYDLRGITSDRCPECGLAIDRAAMSVSRLPWAHRKEIGYFRAYWRTTLVRPRPLAAEMVRPVSYSDAQKFRHVTVLLAWIPLAAWIVVLVLVDVANWTPRLHEGSRLGWWLEGAVLGAILLAGWLFFLMVSGVGSYFFHPKRMPVVQQNRAVALSYYTFGPFAWLWLPAALEGIAVTMGMQDWAQHGFGEKLTIGVAVVGFIPAVAVPVIAWLRITSLVQRTTHCGPGRTWALTAFIPLAWSVCAGIAVGVPAAVFYLSLLILSFR